MSPQSNPREATITPLEAPTSKIHFKSVLWHGIATTHKEAMANGDPVIKETQSIATLFQMSNFLLEADLMLSCKHIFPNVPQKLFPTTRPDDVLGQTLHFTQTPSYQATDVITILAHKFQIPSTLSMAIIFTKRRRHFFFENNWPPCISTSIVKPSTPSMS